MSILEESKFKLYTDRAKYIFTLLGDKICREEFSKVVMSDGRRLSPLMTLCSNAIRIELSDVRGYDNVFYDEIFVVFDEVDSHFGRIVLHVNGQDSPLQETLPLGVPTMRMLFYKLTILHMASEVSLVEEGEELKGDEYYEDYTPRMNSVAAALQQISLV
jgi:hypothetical protein